MILYAYLHKTKPSTEKLLEKLRKVTKNKHINIFPKTSNNLVENIIIKEMSYPKATKQ